jgi:hypothetical protein
MAEEEPLIDEGLTVSKLAKAAGGSDQIQWPVSRWLLPLTWYSA